MSELNDFQYARAGETTVVAPSTKLSKFKRWFRDAVDHSNEWRKEANEDIRFYRGEQWDKSDLKDMEESRKPAITINKINPLINILSGYQRLNRYDIEFLPRTQGDNEQAALRKGITKYILDRSHYNYEETDVFSDGILTGIGWFEVFYNYDKLTGDGDACVRRVSPFDIYPDPESRDRHMRDMKFVIRARWVDKETLTAYYPEAADEINAQTEAYMSEESEEAASLDEQLWYNSETQKIRFAECWYKTTGQKTIYTLFDGSTTEQVTEQMLLSGLVVSQRTVSYPKVRMVAFFDNVTLEDIDSPYEHGKLPFVPFMCYYLGDSDTPRGIVRGLKDPQREINKRRSQELHILNTQSNSGWIAEEGAMSAEQERNLSRHGSTPGVVVKTRPGALTGGRLRELMPKSPPSASIQAYQEAVAELPAISGINEALMGTDISNQQSGRAIELKQKQAITHIAGLFDNLRYAKEMVAELLWGRRGARGIIPQFYTEEKTFRIVGENGENQYVTVNQQVQMQDQYTRQLVTTTLNDLSIGEYDIVISDTPATATARTAQFWSLVDACKNLNIQGPMVMDILLDLSDIPQKEEITRRLKAQQEEQAKAQQAQMQQQLELEKQKRLSRSIAYKDLQLPLQLKLAAQAGIIPEEYANAFLEWSVQQTAQAMGMGGVNMLGGQQQPNMMLQQPQQAPLMQPQPQQQAQQAPVMTQAALSGLVDSTKPVL